MKHFTKVMLLSALLPFSTISNAQQPAMEGGMGMGMEHGMGNMDPAKMTEHLKEMQTRMLKMHDLSNKILAETDPKKQQELKDQQLEIMKAHHMEMMAKHHAKQMERKKAQ